MLAIRPSDCMRPRRQPLGQWARPWIAHPLVAWRASGDEGSVEQALRHSGPPSETVSAAEAPRLPLAERYRFCAGSCSGWCHMWSGLGLSG